MSDSPDANAGAGTWGAEGFVERWTAADSMAEALELPRRMSAAIVADSGIEVRRVVDVGSGTGTYLRALLETFPAADGVWVDASEPMLRRAREALSDLGGRVRFVVADLRDADTLPLEADVVVSSRAVHHFRPDTIRTFYGAAESGLSPGGFLCNLDHFATPGEWEARYRRVKAQLMPRTGTTEPHEHDAPPQPIGDHLRWLEEAGFGIPDIPWRLFWTALLVAQKPSG